MSQDATRTLAAAEAEAQRLQAVQAESAQLRQAVQAAREEAAAARQQVERAEAARRDADHRLGVRSLIFLLLLRGNNRHPLSMVAYREGQEGRRAGGNDAATPAVPFLIAVCASVEGIVPWLCEALRLGRSETTAALACRASRRMSRKRGNSSRASSAASR